jgi:hypothetical protein
MIDEFGFDRIERAESGQAASLLYKVIDSRGPKRSTADQRGVESLDRFPLGNLQQTLAQLADPSAMSISRVETEGPSSTCNGAVRIRNGRPADLLDHRWHAGQRTCVFS